MSKQLPELFDPRYLASLQRSYEGQVEWSALQRLMSLSAFAEGLDRLNYRAALGYFENTRHPSLILHVSGQLRLICQRSLQTFAFDIDAETELVFVDSYKLAADFEERVEVIELDDQDVSALELIEDTVILQIPIVPVAQADQKIEWAVDSGQVMASGRQTPFADLSDLMKQKT